MEDFGFLSLIPAIISIVVAFKTKKVIQSLGTGILLASLILANGNPLQAIILFFQKGIFEQIASDSNMQTIFVMFLIGAFVVLLEKSGGMESFVIWVSKFVRGPKSTQFLCWISGILFMFSSTANGLIIGPIFRPLFDRYKISREKLAYIIDCTGSPVCVLIPFLGWGVYIADLIQKNLPENSNLRGFDLLLTSIQYNFYPILSLLLVLIVIIFKFDFKSMKKAQPHPETHDPKGMESPSTMILFIVPVLVLVTSLTIFLFYFANLHNGLTGVGVRLSMVISFSLAIIGNLILIPKHSVLSLDQATKLVTEGVETILPFCLVLVFAWAIGDMTKAMGASKYCGEILQTIGSPYLLTPLAFILGCLFSFATGSSWSTFALVVPIVLPAAATLDISYSLIIGASISGGIFGDHCSPVSDTTLLSSFGAGCDHIDHVKTQFPYALLVGVISISLYFLLSLI
jgi:Na+/H+ antiporter NhaC